MAEHLADSLRWFHAAGITSITLSLDLWATWVQADAVALGHAIEQAADVWSTNKPAGSVNWFDDSAARLLNLRPAVTQRCGFGVGQITVTPRGNLYPCERIVHEDRDDNPLRLPGNLNDHLDEINFNAWQPFPSRNDPECTDCSLVRMCGTTCRCSNFVRTGDVQRPDGLLCWLETKTLQETARIINQQPAWLLSLASGLEMGENKRARERSLPLGGLSHATKT
jgi:uncharacterized protein